MNARGERILIFGDSLTQHAGGGAQVWDVDQGSQRSHSAPGDLLASLLRDQGAAAVRTNALVSRSAVNFWTREPAQGLIQADLAWRPTKIVFVLGTNDVGMAQAADEAAFVRLRDAYKSSKAELWAIGPFTNRQPAASVAPVQATLRKIFGSRFIDGRPISTMISPGPDGIHYTPQSARLLALNMADALLSKSPMKPWMGIAIGAAVVIGAGLVYGFMTNRRRGLAGIEIVDGRRWDGSTSELVRSGYKQIACKSGLDRNGQARCWSRGGLGGSSNTSFTDLIRDEDPMGMDVAEDLLLERGWKMREVTGGLHARNFTISMKPLWLPREQWKMVQINVYEAGAGLPGQMAIKYTIANGPIRVTLEETMASTPDDARKAAVATGWALAKAIKPLPLGMATETIRSLAQEIVDDGPNNLAKREELFGLPRRSRRRRRKRSRGLRGASDEDAPQPGGDDETWWQRIQRRAREGETRMRTALETSDALILTAKGGRQVLVLKTPEMSNRNEGSVRVTTFDEDGPIGHTTRRSVDELADEVYRDWHPEAIRPASEAEIIAWTSTERFARGAAAVAEVQRLNNRGAKLDGSHLPPGATFLIEEAAAAVKPSGRFGSRKVFISELHQEIQRRGVDISLSDFKRELVRMHKDGNVQLARADLVGAMDPAKVDASETREGPASFHFVVAA